MRIPALCLGLLVASTPAIAQPAHVRFRALAGDGAPIAGLTPADVTLKIDGRPRTVRSLVLRQSDRSAEPVAAAVPPPYATNMGPSGRTIVLLVDEDSMAAGREAPFKTALHGFVAELPADDMVAVVSSQARINVPPGFDRAATHKAIDRISGQGHTDETDVDATCRTIMLLKTVSGIVGAAADTPIVLVLFSGGITPVSADPFRIGTTAGACQLRSEDVQNISRAASTVPLTTYVMHLTEGRVATATTQTAGLESLAGALGGDFIRIPTDATPALARVLRETSAYYDAQFDPEPADRDGQPHRIDVRAARPGARVQTQAAIVLARARASTKSTQDLIRTGDKYRELPLRATAYTARNSGDDSLKLVALFDAPASGRLRAASVALFDARNTLKRQWSAEPADLAKRPMMAALTALRGSYRMRVAAIDDGGRLGTVDYSFDADLARADPLRLSTIVLGTQENNAFAPRLEFTSEPTAIALIEIYGAARGAGVTVSLDVATSDTEAALASADTTVSRTRTDDMLLAFGGFDISRLAPGDYLVRATVLLDGKPVGRVTRTLRKTAG